MKTKEVHSCLESYGLIKASCGMLIVVPFRIVYIYRLHTNVKEE